MALVPRTRDRRAWMVMALVPHAHGRSAWTVMTLGSAHAIAMSTDGHARAMAASTNGTRVPHEDRDGEPRGVAPSRARKRRRAGAQTAIMSVASG
jgi:hypothetical protein